MGRFSVLIIKTPNNSYIPLIKRDSEAPTHPNELCSPSGISEEKEENINPRILKNRELIEELIIKDKQENKLIVPKSNENLKIPHEYNKSVRKLNIEYNDIKSKKIRTKKYKKDSFKIISENITNIVKGNFILDPNTKHVNLIDLDILSLEKEIEKFEFYDGELFDENPLNRKVALFKMNSFEDLFKNKNVNPEYIIKNGERIDNLGELSYEIMTKTLKDTIELHKDFLFGKI